MLWWLNSFVFGSIEWEAKIHPLFLKVAQTISSSIVEKRLVVKNAVCK